ncbi:CHASE3 domain-containing protein [Rhodococcus jostii]|uniref:Histidine kinase-, DNA gyrase B-, and HSP90-like ATPase n=1 Tax=Rhodococcus jostii TaxID=132919 RepID=A0A1H4ZUB5_RHOJO|nr:CHASE3 domain-containing protein [Rhodococcus jostii]SED33485.1 Histidine kinase-, DNA gyrase B-, and HSP90-like ATPase [Rhodococcus jostii]
MTQSGGKTTRISLRALLWLAITILVSLFAVSVVFSVYGRNGVRDAVDELAQDAMPAQQSVAMLRTAFVDQETGQRGFVVTGDPRFLEPYDAGRGEATKLLAALDADLADDGPARAALEAVKQAARDWTAQAAEPEIAAFRAGPVPPDPGAAVTTSDKQLFDTLRNRLDALDTRTDELVAAQIQKIHSAQRTANIATAVALMLAVVTVLVAGYLTQRMLTRPITNLLTDITAVADGEYTRPIGGHGPREVAVIADAVNRMRVSLLAQSDQLVRAARERTRHEEQTRVATDLHDLTIQRVFGLGLALTSLARRHPRQAAELDPLIDETDSIVRGLRAVIFDLSHHDEDDRDLKATVSSLSGAVGEIVERSTAALGFTPDVSIEGPADTFTREVAGAALEAALTEALSNIARHAHATTCHVQVTASGHHLAMRVTDNGTGISPGARRGRGLANIRHRAEELGGSASIRTESGAGTIVEWDVPATRPRSPRPDDSGTITSKSGVAEAKQ